MSQIGKLVNIPAPLYNQRRRLRVDRTGLSPGRTVKVRGSRNGTKRTNGRTAQVGSTWGPWKGKYNVRTEIRHRCSCRRKARPVGNNRR